MIEWVLDEMKKKSKEGKGEEQYMFAVGTEEK
jgi:hypothetical protein